MNIYATALKTLEYSYAKSQKMIYLAAILDLSYLIKKPNQGKLLHLVCHMKFKKTDKNFVVFDPQIP